MARRELTFDFDNLKNVLETKIRTERLLGYTIEDTFDGIKISYRLTTEVNVIEWPQFIRFSFYKEGTGYTDHDISREKPEEIEDYALGLFKKLLKDHNNETLRYFNCIPKRSY